MTPGVVASCAGQWHLCCPTGDNAQHIIRFCASLVNLWRSVSRNNQRGHCDDPSDNCARDVSSNGVLRRAEKLLIAIMQLSSTGRTSRAALSSQELTEGGATVRSLFMPFHMPCPSEASYRFSASCDEMERICSEISQLQFDDGQRESLLTVLSREQVGALVLAVLWRHELVLELTSVICGDVTRNAFEARMQLDAWNQWFQSDQLLPRWMQRLAQQRHVLPQMWSFSSVQGTAFSVDAAQIVDVWYQQERRLDDLTTSFHALRIRVSWALIRYLYTSSPGKLLSVVLSSMTSVFAARLVVSQLRHRCATEQDLCHILKSQWTGQHRVEGLRGIAAVLAVGMAHEAGRLAVLHVLRKVAASFIAMQSVQKREQSKLAVYRLLIAQPLAFFDLHSPDDVEEMVLYVNDLEGVDVHVLTFIQRLQHTACALFGMSCAVSRISSWSLAACGGDGTSSLVFVAKYPLVVAAVGVMVLAATDYMAQAALKMHAQWRSSASTRRPDDDVEDLEEIENTASGGGTSLLTGMEVLQNVHALRPQGRADARLMEGWCTRLEHAMQLRGRSSEDNATSDEAEVERRVDTTTSRCAIMSTLLRWNRGLVDATRSQLPLWRSIVSKELCMSAIVAHALTVVPSVTRWAVPMMVRILHATALASLREEGNGGPTGHANAADLIPLVEDAWYAIVDSRRIVDLVVCNGHKAWALQQLELRAGGRSSMHTDSNSAATRLPTTVHSLAARELSFRYPSRTESNSGWSLRNISLDITALPGRLVCITGPSGCGKTTLLSLLLGLYSSENDGSTLSGSLDARVCCKSGAGVHESEAGGLSEAPAESDVSLLSPCSHAAHDFRLFSYVPQSSHIFPGTVAQNVALAQDVSVMDVGILGHVERCCRFAQCWDFIASLREGLLTKIAPQGSTAGRHVGLSGGQAQRLMIARALFQGGRVLLMDEPTANLDSGTKAALLTDLRRLLTMPRAMGDGDSIEVQSIIAVTHDAYLLSQADVVVHME